jgi:hypothetical protein
MFYFNFLNMLTPIFPIETLIVGSLQSQFLKNPRKVTIFKV